MARLTLYFCDLCSGSQPTPFKHKLTLGVKGTRGMLKKGDVCESCYSSLVEKIESEPTQQQTRPPLYFPPGVRSSAAPISLDEEGEVVRAASALSIDDIRKMNVDSKDKCSHERITMSDDGPLCKGCKEIVEI